MCGGEDTNMGRQLRIVNTERLIERTIRLLKENTTDEIIITANNDMFDNLGVEVIKDYGNTYKSRNNFRNYDVGCWVDGFIQLDEPVTYLFGDRYYSKEAIKTIVNENMGFVTFFGTNIEALTRGAIHITRPDCILAIKVNNLKVWKDNIAKAREMYYAGDLPMMPKCFTMYRLIHSYPVNKQIVAGAHYITINDASTAVDSDRDVEWVMNIERDNGNIIKTVQEQPQEKRYTNIMNKYDPFRRNW